MYGQKLPYGEDIICHVCDPSLMPGKHLKLPLKACVCVRACVCACVRVCVFGSVVCARRPVSEQCVVCAGAVMDVVFLCRGNWSLGH